MSDQPSAILSKIAFYQNRRDEVPNQQLASELAETRNIAGIQEVASHLWDKNKNVRSDCLKVLYEIGYLAPDLIVDCAGDFLKLLHDKNNRMVWGAMIGLATIAHLCADEIWAQVDVVTKTVENGSLITVVWGIKALAKVAATSPERRNKIFPFLLQQVKACIPRDVPMHAENILCAVDESVKMEFLTVLDARSPEMTGSQVARLRKVQKSLR
jgi:hypothetical protein